MIALAVLLAAPVAADPRPVTVEALRAHLGDWDGRRVEVRGWLHGCAASVPNLAGRCYITPSSRWRQGRDRLKLAGFPRATGGGDDDTVTEAVVRGVVEEDRCPADTICLDGESDIRVDTVLQTGKHR